MTDAALLAALDRCVEGIEPITCRLRDPVNRLSQVVQRVREVQGRVRQGDPGMNCCYAARTGEVLDEQAARLEQLRQRKAGRTLASVGAAMAHLTNADNLDVPADVRVARAVRVLSELATRLEQEQRKTPSPNFSKTALQKAIDDYNALHPIDRLL